MPSSCRSVSLMKREPSASSMNLSLLSRGSLSRVQDTAGAGVPDASQMSVVGWLAEVKTSEVPTFNTGAGEQSDYIQIVRNYFSP